jgi:hypothetical protein
MRAAKLAEALRLGIEALTCAGSRAECQSLEVYAKEQMRQALASYEAEAKPADLAQTIRGITEGYRGTDCGKCAESIGDRLIEVLAAPAAPAPAEPADETYSVADVLRYAKDDKELSEWLGRTLVPGVVEPGTWAHLKLMIEVLAWDGVLNLDDALQTVDDFVRDNHCPECVKATAPAAPAPNAPPPAPKPQPAA